MANEISTYLATLKYGETNPTSSIDIKSFPSILAPKSAIEVTNMADGARRFIQGIRETPENFEFTANWDATVFADLNALTKSQHCSLEFSDGSKFTWDGYISASNSEGGVNEVIEMTISITPSTVPVFVPAT